MLLNGDKFGNTMKMVMAMRMADVDPGTAQAKFKEAIAGGVLTVMLITMHYPYTV